MTRPTKADFRDVEELLEAWKYHFDWQHPFFKESPLKELSIGACEEFSDRVYDEYHSYLERMQKLYAYRWLRADLQWERFNKALYKSSHPRRISRPDFVKRTGEWIFQAARPMTKDEYKKDCKLSEEMAQRRRQRMLDEAYTDGEIEKFLQEDELYKIKSIDEINSVPSRLKKLNEKAIDCMQFYFMSPDSDILILSSIGRYFYDQSYLDEFTSRQLDREALEEAEAWDENIESGLRAIDDLMPLLEEHLEIAEDFEEEVEIDKFKKLIAWLRAFGEKLEWHHGSMLYDLESELKGRDIIKRKDETARERALAYDLWRIIRKYSRKRPTTAIYEFLQIGGIFNTPDLRTVERWVEAWDKAWKEELMILQNPLMLRESDS